MFFNGIFSYYSTNPSLQRIQSGIQQGYEDYQADEYYKRFKVKRICFDKDYFVKYWQDDAHPHSVYEITDLSFSFFISNLVDTLAKKSVGQNNFIWFALDKEPRKIADF